MKNILFVNSSSELYGADRSLINLVKNLDKEKFKSVVVLPEDGPLVKLLKEVDGVEVIIQNIAVLRRKNLSVKGMANYAKDFFQSISFFKKLIKEKNIDVVYTNTTVVFPGGIAAKSLKKKSVWHVREIISNKFERSVVAFVANRYSDVIIANSKATADAFCKSNKMRVVYNAIESKGTEIVNRPDGEEIVVGMAGRINRWKGQKLFVDMAEKVLKSGKKVKFLIAGDAYNGESRLVDDLKDYIKSKKLENDITLLGQVNDMDSFYRSLDIFVLPSIQPEPFGLVVIEAMDRGLPVVATRHGGPVEIIDDGINGYLVDYTEATEMSEKVLKLIEDKNLRKEIGLKGKEKREKMFNLENYVSGIEKVLLSMWGE